MDRRSEDGTTRGRVTSTSPTLAHLFEYETITESPVRAVPVALAVSAVVLGTAMPLTWHHLHIPGDGFQVITGLDTATWVIVSAIVALALAVRTWMRRLGLAMKWTISLLAFATLQGMIFDYFDWGSRGVSLYVPAYYGPGFFLALGGAMVMVAAAVAACRVRD